MFDAPQAVHNGMAVEVDDPVLGAVQQVAGPLRFSAAGHRAQPAPAPASGQHTAEILAELRQSPPRAAARGSAAQPAAGDGRPLLDGLKVLDMGAFYAGPYSSRLLADLGADVIKLEPVAGDPMRGLERVFRSANAGKRSIAANVKDPAAGAVLRRLIEWADVVHHNMRPGAAERLGVGYEQVASVNPDAVYAYAPGWGATGPYAGRQSFAPLLSGYVGAGFEVAGQFNAPLWPVGNEDPGNGLLGTIGMLMALVYRQRHGAGQLVENPQLNAGMALMAHVVRRADGTVLGADRLDPPQTGVSALERLYETADGWLLLAVGKEQEFDALGKALGTDLKSDPEVRDPRGTTRQRLRARPGDLVGLGDRQHRHVARHASERGCRGSRARRVQQRQLHARPRQRGDGPGRGLPGPGWPYRARAGPAAAGQRQHQRSRIALPRAAGKTPASS